VSEKPEVDNLALWRKVEKTDPANTKAVKFGSREFTSIDPTFQCKQATELFGPYGDKWGLYDLKFTTLATEPPSLMLQADFVYPHNGDQCSFPIAVDMKLKAGDDITKKIVTSAISKALSRLGFSADVYMGKFDDAAYVTDQKIRSGEQKEFMTKALAQIKKSTTEVELDKCAGRVNQLIAGDTLDEGNWRELLRVIAERRESILTDAE
jgi:hypothetical protein